MTELAAFYHRDKFDYTLNYPLEFVSGQDGVTREVFDYFPEHHYREGFEELRDTVSDSTLDEWIDRVVGHEPVQASHGGLWKEDVPGLIHRILAGDRFYEAEITVKPEPRPDGYDYVVEWKRVDFDEEAIKWKPVNELHDTEG